MPIPVSFSLDSFIARHVIGRDESMFQADVTARDAELRRRIGGTRVLVIGGAGTIGSSFIRALLKYEPSSLYVVDLDENGLTELTRDLRSTAGQFVPADYKTYPISFGGPIFERMLRHTSPFDIVAHFAAHKHVRSEKDRYSIEAMLENNVISTVKLLDLLLERPPAHFFCVSTDKAANPANVMGASKKLMEEAVLAYSAQLPAVTARFANVAFSNGSLPAGFLERIARDQPLSAPLDVRRYFVSPEESGELCLLACILGRPGDIFFPLLDAAGKTGAHTNDGTGTNDGTNDGTSTSAGTGHGSTPAENTRTFSAIADALLAELGYTPRRFDSEEGARRNSQTRAPDDPWPVYYFVSKTSGEKPFEEFHTDGEIVDRERFAALGVIEGRTVNDVPGIRSLVSDLRALFAREDLDKQAIVDVLARLVPTFTHVETGVGLDTKM